MSTDCHDIRQYPFRHWAFSKTPTDGANKGQATVALNDTKPSRLSLIVQELRKHGQRYQHQQRQQENDESGVASHVLKVGWYALWLVGFTVAVMLTFGYLRAEHASMLVEGEFISIAVIIAVVGVHLFFPVFDSTWDALCFSTSMIQGMDAALGAISVASYLSLSILLIVSVLTVGWTFGMIELAWRWWHTRPVLARRLATVGEWSLFGMICARILLSLLGVSGTDDETFQTFQTVSLYGDC